LKIGLEQSLSPVELFPHVVSISDPEIANLHPNSLSVILNDTSKSPRKSNDGSKGGVIEHITMYLKAKRDRDNLTGRNDKS
jgi:hypothetical protein